MGIFGPRGKRLSLLPNGVAWTDNRKFRRIAAFKPGDGDPVYYVAEGGYRWQTDFTNEVDRQVKAGHWPQITTDMIRTTALEEISRLYAATPSQNAERQYGSTIVKGGGVANSAVARFQKVLADAARSQASDLKIYQHVSHTSVRMKIAGREYPAAAPWTADEGMRAISWIFDKRDEGGGDTSSLAMAFQSFSVSRGGRIALPTGVIKLRGQKGYHETPQHPANHMVLRLFYDDTIQTETASLLDLGFDGEVMDALAHARREMRGAVIIGGSTGDGKSTTLVRCLAEQYHENDGRISIVTIEDPVEYTLSLDGVIQIPVKSAGTGAERAASYRKALMHFVRINPDVGCISEIRDGDAASEVIQFVDTGHQVWTTLHVNSANGILFRLIDMGLPPSELTKPGSIAVLMKQTLVPVLCKSCRIPYHQAGGPDWLPNALASTDTVNMRNIEGCTHCSRSSLGSSAVQAWSGYTRLIAVAEVIIPDEQYNRSVQQRDAISALKHWLAPVETGGLGGQPMTQKLQNMVGAGVLDPLDAIRKGWSPKT